MKRYIKFSAIAALALGMTGCTGSFEEINTDPDAYSTAPITNMLAYDIEQMSVNWGDELSRLTDWAGYMVSSYANETFNYLPTNNEFGNKWYQTYMLNSQLQDIIDRTDPVATKNNQNAAKLLQQFLFFNNVDCFGDCPYSEACQGVSGGTIKPKFDKDEDIYNGIATELKAIADSWAEGIGGDALGDGDLLYGGDVEMWQRWCNSLRLRLAMRLSNMSSQVEKSKATFKEILGNPSKYPVIEESSQNCYFWWDGSSNYRERWYNNRLSRPVDFNMSQVMVDRLVGQEDPRLATICLPATEDGEYRGVLHGSNAQYNGDGFGHYSLCGDMYYGNPAGFSPYFRAAETWFLIEEAALKGWISYSAEEAYNNAVACSMADNGIAQAESEAYLEGKGKYNGTLDQLYMEEWVALFKQSQEAWSLYRRTGYPKVLFDEVTYQVSKVTCAQYPGERNAWGYGATAVHNDLPFRFPYPNSEYTYNEENTKAAAEGIVNHCWGKRLCWALENGRK